MINIKTHGKRQENLFNYLAVIVLALSFFVLGMFRAFEMGNGRNLVAAGSSAFSSYWSYVVFMAALSWAIFELVLRLYYFFVSFSIYTFTIPKKYAFGVFRVVYALRNLIIAGISFLLFIQPLFFLYLPAITLVIDFLVFVCAFLIIKKKYLNVLLAPFAWKAFLRPFVIYETLIIAFQLGGLL